MLGLHVFEKLLHEENIFLFDTPHEGVRPGAVVVHGRVVQHLTDFRDFFQKSPALQMSKLLPASTQLQDLTHETAGGVGLGVGLPGMGSVGLALRSARTVKLSVKGVVKRYLQSGQDVLGHPNYLEADDYCVLATENQSLLQFAPFRDRMKKRRWGIPTPREIDIAESLVYIDELDFDFQTDVDLSAELTAEQLADVKAGLTVEYDGKTKLTWKNHGRIPFGFCPVRYAWRPAKGRFELAET